MWEEAEQFLLKDKYIAPLIDKYGHCSLKPRPKKYYFEDLVDAIVQQQLSMKAASSIFNRIKEAMQKNYELRIKNYGSENKPKAIRYKQKATSDKKHKWRVDITKNIEITPGKILALSDQELRNCGLSRAKAVYVKDLAEKVISNPPSLKTSEGQSKLDLTRLGKLSDEEVIRELVAVKGIGEWTAHMFLMFTLGRPDVFPVGDLGLRNAFEKVVKNGLDKAQMEKFAFRWKPYRTAAAWYLWRSLEND